MTTPAVGAEAAPAVDPANPAATPAPAPAPAAPAADPVVTPPLPITQAAADPKPAPAPVLADPATDDITPVSYDPTGDTALDVALSFVGNLGIGLDHPAMAATSNGDFSLLKAHLATMGDKARGWEQMVALGEKAYADHAAKATEQATKTLAAVTAVAGSKEAWDTMKAWAATNASADEKAALNAMFDAGPTQARAAAMLIQTAYAKASGTVVKPAAATRDASAGAAPGDTAGPLTPREYSAAVRDLHNKLGTRMERSPEYADLRRRLAAGQR